MNAGPPMQVNIVNSEAGRTDSISFPTRSWTVGMLQKAYRETIIQMKLGKFNAWWFNYSEIVFSFNGVDMEEKFTLARYGIRPGSMIQATITPKVKIAIKNQAGQKKTYNVEALFDWTIQEVKEEYCKVRREIAPHDWVPDDVVLMDWEGKLVDDSGNLSDYASRLRDRRGDLWLKSNYRKNGTSYCIGVSGAEPTERLPEEEMAAAWDDPALDF